MAITLEVEFPLLEAAVRRMGAKKIVVELPVDRELKEGKQITLDDVESRHGLLLHDSRPVILYIQDHSYGNMFEKAMEDGSKGNRFHVAYCERLQKMWAENRGKRYVVTNDLSGEFVIKGEDDEPGTAKLQVCKKCLEELNYSGYRNKENWGDKVDICYNFHIPIFFETYGSCFPFPRSRRAGDKEYYTSDWEEVSWNYRKRQNFTCEECGVNLSQRNHNKLLHTHHINGVKSDNSEDNLQALCVGCHSRQPYHQHMNNNEIFHKSFEQVKQLRQEQGLPLTDIIPENLETDTFDEIF